MTFYWVHYETENRLLEVMDAECVEDLKLMTSEEIDRYIGDANIAGADMRRIGGADELVRAFNNWGLDDVNGSIFYTND